MSDHMPHEAPNETIRRLETELKEAKGLLNLKNTMVESSSDGIVVIQDECFVYVNRKVEEHLNRPGHDIIGHPIAEFIHHDDTLRVIDNYRLTIGDVEGKTFPGTPSAP